MQEKRSFAKGGIPKSWQDKRILRHIRDNYTGKKRRTAMTIYLVMTELASNKEEDTFQAYQNTIADMSGVSYSTARNYLNAFISMSIIKKECVKNGKINHANNWTLLEFSPMTFARVTSINNKKHRGEQINETTVNDKQQTL